MLQVMQWGLVPSWHHGDSPSSFGSILNNCRCETMFEKPSFRAIEKGRRCVVVADGYVTLNSSYFSTALSSYPSE